jgi:hypothetical protein
MHTHTPARWTFAQSLVTRPHTTCLDCGDQLVVTASDPDGEPFCLDCWLDAERAELERMEDAQ